MIENFTIISYNENDLLLIKNTKCTFPIIIDVQVQEQGQVQEQMQEQGQVQEVTINIDSRL